MDSNDNSLTSIILEKSISESTLEQKIQVSGTITLKHQKINFWPFFSKSANLVQ